MVLIITLSLSTTAAAKSPEEQATTQEYKQGFEEAKEYLKSLCEVKTNEFGKEFTTVYQFETEYDLNEAATYIVENGLDEFNKAVDAAVEKFVSSEPKPELISPKSTTPTVVYETISGDGSHVVSGEAYGLASFESLGGLEYSVCLSYTVTVSNGEITGLSSINFDIDWMGFPSGGWEGLSIPFYTTSTHAGATANYTITKSVSIAIGDFEFIIVTESDNEIFSILTTLV